MGGTLCSLGVRMIEAKVRGLSLTVEQELVTEQCCSCGVIFAMPKEFEQQCRRQPGVGTGKPFFCPAGHQQWYTGATEATKLREQLDEERRKRQSAEQQIEYEAQIRRQETERADRERRRANGYKGHATRITKRAKSGVCPCCNRTFKQLAAHMANKHPQFTPLELEQGATVQ